MTALGIALGALIGVALGLLGGGGSILTVPVFVYVLHLPPKEAIAMSLPVVGVASLIGAARHWRAGNLDLRIALVFAAVAMVTAYGGARLSVAVPGRIQLIALGLVMLAAAVSMLRAPPGGADRPRSWAILSGAAAATGLLTGLVGVGGGFLIVPALVLLAAVPMHRAVGTSLLVIAMNTASAFAGQPAHGALRWGLLATFTGAAVAGIFVGTSLAPRVPAARLKRGFAAFLVALALYIFANAATG